MPNLIESYPSIPIQYNPGFHQSPVGGRIDHFLQFWQENVRDKFCQNIVRISYNIQWFNNLPPLSYQVRGTISSRCVDKTDNRKGYRDLSRVQCNSFSSAQEGWGNETSDQSESSEQVFSHTQFQNAYSPINSQNESEGQLVGVNRFERRVFSCSNTSRIQEISQVCLPRSDISVQGASLRGFRQHTRCFKKMLASIITMLHQKAIQLYPYLGDMLIVATSQVKMKYTIDNTLQTLQKAGFINDVRNFCSLVHHPKARSMDGLGVRLNQNCYYTFLPAPILSQLLMKVVLEGATMILIAPKWPRREWYPTLLDLRIDVPIRLPLIPDLVTQDQGTLWHQYPADWHWWPGG